MVVDVDSVESELNAYTRVQQVTRVRVPSPGPDDQATPDCSWHFCVS
jgi:hypothetical protein